MTTDKVWYRAELQAEDTDRLLRMLRRQRGLLRTTGRADWAVLAGMVRAELRMRSRARVGRTCPAHHPALPDMAA